MDAFGAPRYPELVLVSTEERLAEAPEMIAAVVRGLERGYRDVVADPLTGLDALVDAVPALDGELQTAQLEALLEADAFSPPLALERRRIVAWAGQRICNRGAAGGYERSTSE